MSRRAGRLAMVIAALGAFLGGNAQMAALRAAGLNGTAPERYYGLTWPGWVGVAVAGGVLYAAVRLSPLGLHLTVTVVVLVLAFLASMALALQGQTIGPGRYLLALYRYRRTAKKLVPPTRPDKFGVVLDVAPGSEVEADPVVGGPAA